jgi:hypothetical protein
VTSTYALPNSLKDSNANPEMKTSKEGIGVCYLAHNTSWVKEAFEALGWGLRRMTNGSIIHMDLHKTNNKLVNA